VVRSWVVIALAGAVGVAALVHALAGGGAGANGRTASQQRPLEALRGPDLPQPGALAGSLLFGSEGCRLQELELATLELRVNDREADCTAGSPEPDVSPAASALTLVDEPGEQQLVLDGRTLIDESDLRRGFPRTGADLRILGYDMRTDGLLAVAVSAARASGRPPQLFLELWRGGRSEGSISLRAAAYPFANRSFGELVRFSPNGRELAVGFEGAGVPLMLFDAETLGTVLRPTVQYGFAWSPDGVWLALSSGRDVVISGTLRSEPVYVLPVRATELAWR
jgi:hypothetical protein